MMSEDLRQIQDPTLLTTQQILREVFSARELIETRISAMDKAIELLQHVSDKSQNILEVAATVAHLQELHAEKFRNIGTQFLERDTRAEQTSRDSKVAIDAALQAAKDAVGEQNKSSALAIAKSEAGTTKQIDQIIVLINTTTKYLNDLLATTTMSLNDKIDDIKGRLTTIEGRSKGPSDLWGYVVGAIGLFMTMATLAVLVYQR